MKTINSIFIVALLIFSLNVNAQNNNIKANGQVVTTTRTVDNFDNINVSGSFDVDLVKGKEGDISIEASENLMDVIVTEVVDGTLKIKFKKGVNIRNSKTIHITVSYATIEGVSLAGSGNIHTDDVVNAANLDLSLSGSGSIQLGVSCTNLSSSISGSGNMNLNGKTDVFSCSISGSGNVNSSELIANTVHAKISGSGNIKVNAIQEINAKTSGSGNVIYTGNPATVKANSSGSGSVRNKN